ncbi:MAG: hypothetical protein ACR2QB_07390 [Gammaproteobacteria bacterium]
MSAPEEPVTAYDETAQAAVDLGNQLLDTDGSADSWEVASGLLAGAIQFWLFSRQPCDDAFCESCAEVSTADRRLQLLLEEASELAQSSDYFDSPRDVSAGTH